MTKRPPKVTANLAAPITTIDHTTGDVTVTRKGVLKGFGEGFRDYLKGSVVQVDIEAFTGQFPETHHHAGKWCVYVCLSPCETQEQANELADMITPIVRNAIRTKLT